MVFAALTLSASFVGGAWAHGFMISPVPRQPGVPSFEVAGTGCGSNSCSWYSNKVTIPGTPTNCDPSLATTGQDEPCLARATWINDKPWRAPGTAPILSPCGSLNGKDGASLPPAERMLWPRGGVVEVAHSVTANHGGGYAFRLCPRAEAPTEACFQTHHLAFAENMTTVRFLDGSTTSIPSLSFMTPEGRQWKRNPIPKDPVRDKFPAPFSGGQGSNWAFSLVDRLILPAELLAGDYLVSWRWDCEENPQIWTNCGDVTLVEGLLV